MNAHPQSVSQKLRMAGRDYTRRGWVFVTLSADDHRHLFGGIGDAPVMVPNALGRLVADDWARIPAYFSGVRLGAFQIMPNHFHGLLWLSGFQTAAHPGGNTPGPEKIVSLGEIINPFKGGVTRKWRRVVASRFEGSRFSESSPLCVWQPNYWDVICFNDEELAQKEAYIRANPLRWTLKRLPRGRVPEGRYLGNLALLRAAPKRALRISRRATAEDIEKAFAEASDNGASGNAVVVGTVFSPGERAVLDRLLARSDARLIWLAPMCLPETVPSKWGGGIGGGPCALAFALCRRPARRNPRDMRAVQRPGATLGGTGNAMKTNRDLSRLSESQLEDAALAWLKELGYAVAHGPHIAPGETAAERDSFGDTVLIGRLRDAVARLNTGIPAEAQEDAVRKVLRVVTPSLVQTNRAFHRMLRDGIPVEYRRQAPSPQPSPKGRGFHADMPPSTLGRGDGGEGLRWDIVKIIDFDDPAANDWLAVNQFAVVEGQASRRPDIVLFVNGLPLAVIELKNAADEQTTVWSAYAQLQTYKADIPSLLGYNAMLVASDGVAARAGSITADQEWFKVWREIDAPPSPSPSIPLPKGEGGTATGMTLPLYHWERGRG